MEDKRKVGLLLLDAFDLADTLEGAWIVDATAKTVQGVCREDDGTTVGQAFQNHLDVARVRICRVEFEYHRLAKKSCKNKQNVVNGNEKPLFLQSIYGSSPADVFCFYNLNTTLQWEASSALY